MNRSAYRSRTLLREFVILSFALLWATSTSAQSSTRVWNLEVANNHSMVVGNRSVCVHNVSEAHLQARRDLLQSREGTYQPEGRRLTEARLHIEAAIWLTAIRTPGTPALLLPGYQIWAKRFPERAQRDARVSPKSAMILIKKFPRKRTFNRKCK